MIPNQPQVLCSRPFHTCRCALETVQTVCFGGRMIQCKFARYLMQCCRGCWKGINMWLFDGSIGLPFVTVPPTISSQPHHHQPTTKADPPSQSTHNHKQSTTKAHLQSQSTHTTTADLRPQPIHNQQVKHDHHSSHIYIHTNQVRRDGRQNRGHRPSRCDMGD